MKKQSNLLSRHGSAHVRNGFVTCCLSLASLSLSPARTFGMGMMMAPPGTPAKGS